jgi:hypothetical protein
MPKKLTKRDLNVLTRTELRNQKLKVNAPVKGKIVTNEEKNRGVLNTLLKKVSK